jgi:hypothetical protein
MYPLFPLPSCSQGIAYSTNTTDDLFSLAEHAMNKHSKTIKECFPTFEEKPAK